MQNFAKAIRTVHDFPIPGIPFKDITPLLGDATLMREVVHYMAAPFKEAGITRVVGIESRGFILGSLLAHTLGAGFVPVRKKGKLPYRTYTEEYALEYGTDTIEMHTDALSADDRVLIHDDVLATGGTAAACLRLVQHSGAAVAGYAFLLEIQSLSGRHLLQEDLHVHVAITV